MAPSQNAETSRSGTRSGWYRSDQTGPVRITMPCMPPTRSESTPKLGDGAGGQKVSVKEI